MTERCPNCDRLRALMERATADGIAEHDALQAECLRLREELEAVKKERDALARSLKAREAEDRWWFHGDDPPVDDDPEEQR